jgi:hypothetical protein
MPSTLPVHHIASVVKCRYAFVNQMAAVNCTSVFGRHVRQFTVYRRCVRQLTVYRRCVRQLTVYDAPQNTVNTPSSNKKAVIADLACRVPCALQ